MKKANLLFLNILLIIGSILGGYYFGHKGYELEIKKSPVFVDIINKTPNLEMTADFSQFWQVWEEVNQRHISKPLDSQALVQGAIKGMVKAIDDPYTMYLEPRDNSSSDQMLKGEYEGIGAELTMKNEVVTVVAPFDSSPAKKSGVRPGDKILSVDGVTTIGEELYDVVERIKGPADTKVVLTLLRESKDEPFDIEITRGNISLDTVTYEIKDAGTAYIRISRFGNKTNEEWDKAVRDIIIGHPDVTSIVLDLRGNPGGYLGSAVHVASEFIGSGVVVREEFYDGKTGELKVDHKGQLVDKKLIILIDEGSASASEIMAGALKERVKAVLVGTKSFGKGTVQEPIDYPNGAGLNLTIAKWLTPNGFWVHGVGLEPDHLVELTDEQLQNQDDKQLEKALELVK